MGEMMDKERTEAFAKEALGWLTARGIAPSPQNFELAYAYVSGENADLKSTVDSLAGNECKFEPSVMSILHQRYFRAPRHDDAVADVGEKIGAELDSILQMLEAAAEDHSAFGHTLSKATGELGAGTLGEHGVKALIGQLVSATRTMESRSKLLEQQLHTSSREVTDLRDRLELVRQESLTDQLTGIPNRKAFDNELQTAMEQAQESGEPLCLVMCDIDHFKKFNDTWGHRTGDQVLRLVGNCLSENVKGRDTAARYGGEEFAVILPHTDPRGAFSLAEQLRSKVESKKLVKKSTGDILGVITISAGVTQYISGESTDEFIQRADACLYAAKRSGRNRVMNDAGPPPKRDAHAAA